MSGLLLAIIISAVLAALAQRLTVADHSAAEDDAVIRQVDHLLPQTQCGDCGYAGCRPYAEAIVRAGERIDRCPPGGNRTRNGLALLLGRAHIRSDNTLPPPVVAEIDPLTCIGCVKCIRACPVDAIAGAPGQLHMVIPALCTGCQLCIPPCPVDCITLQTVTQWQWHNPASRSRYQTA
ncbi:MAG: RnfABCDGE type electron transport complex subunit B [Gammaproteobacteria bacterium]